MNVDHTRRARVRRFVLLSSIGAAETGIAYLRAKAAAEKIVRDSGLDWIMLRPSAIVGPGRQPLRIFVPVVAALRYVPGLQRIADDYRPVHVEVLARALFAAVQQPQTAGEIWSGKTIWGK